MQQLNEALSLPHILELEPGEDGVEVDPDVKQHLEEVVQQVHQLLVIAAS